MHHIEKIRDAPDKRLDIQNTMAVCHGCHEEVEGMSWVELQSFLLQLETEKD
jgi:hypothetical protein